MTYSLSTCIKRNLKKKIVPCGFVIGSVSRQMKSGSPEKNGFFNPK